MILYCGLVLVTCCFAYPIVTRYMWQTSVRTRLIPYSYSKQQMLNGVCFAVLFLLLFAVSAFRYGVGIDYNQYRNNFDAIFYGDFVVTEMGYNALVKLVYWLAGSRNYKIIFAVFSFVTVTVFLRAMAKQSEKFFISFYLFMTLGLYFTSFNIMRYYFTLGFALLLMKDVNDKKYLKFLLLTLLLSLFHKSVLIIIPIYFLANLKWKRWQLAVLALLASTGLFFDELYMKLFVAIYSSYEGTEFLNDTGGSLIGIIRCVAVIALALIYYEDAIKDNPKNQFYLRLNYFALLLYVFFTFVPMLSRLGYYMTVSQILLIPSILVRIKSVKQRRFFTVATICFGIGYFVLFLMQADDPSIMLLPYETWLLK